MKTKVDEDELKSCSDSINLYAIDLQQTELF